MERNELVVNPQKKINNYLFNACLLCVVLSYDNLYPWFYENYLQLYYNAQKSDRYKNQGWLDFYGGWTSPERVLKYKRFQRWYFKENSIIEFIEESIDRGYHIFTYIDEYCIKNSMHHGTHFVHDTFIYGYDKISQVIKVVAYDNNINFLKYSISYCDFENAFREALEITAQEHGWNGQYCVLIKCKYDKNYVYKFRLEKFLGYLSDYLSSSNTSLREKPNYKLYLNADNIFGISVYEHILKYLMEVADDDREIFYPSFHTLYEHKVGIKERLEYINNNYEISESFSNMVNRSNDLIKMFNKVRMLAIKYNILRERRTIERMCEIITKGKTFEFELLSDVYKAINKWRIKQ